MDSTDWFPYFNAIQGILSRQMDTEEFSVFERVREALEPDELDALGRRLVYERHQRISAAVRPSLGRADAAPQRLPTRSMGAVSKAQTDGGSTTF